MAASTVSASGAGITCPACGSPDMDVRDSRPGNGYIRRRRQCGACPAERITTVEIITTGEFAGAALMLQEINALPLDRRVLVRQLIRELAT